MIHEFNHVGIFIRNLEASLAFYTGFLGGDVRSHVVIPSNGTDCVYIQIAGGLVELLRPRDPAPETTFGLNHLAFLSDDLDADFARLTEAGSAPLVPPRVAGSGRGRLAFLSDPNGVRVELLQRDEEFRTTPVTTGPVRAIDHVSVEADDLAAAEAFYGDRLSMTRLPRSGAYYGLGPDVVELHHEAGRRDGGVIRHLVLRVDDGELRSRGDTLTDPDGVRVELVP